MADRPRRTLVPLPDRDFDTTESSVVWDALDRAGHEVVFATEHGAVAECDRHLLGPGWRNPFPAEPAVVATYHRMTASPNFRRPIRYSEIDVSDFDAVHLSGGHSPGMKQYLDSGLLQAKVATFDAAGKPIGAVCHGVLVAARARDQETGKSLLAGRTVTTLIKPIERYAFRRTFYRVGRRYRTYRTYTEDEVRAAVGPAGRIEHGSSWQEPLVVVDGLIVTARYPVDVEAYAERFVRLVENVRSKPIS
jgi:putative intracellular protease/amidase